MRWGVSGANLPKRQSLRYAEEITAACAAVQFPACFAYAIAWRELETSIWVATQHPFSATDKNLANRSMWLGKV